MSFRVLTKEGITQRDSLNALHVQIIQQIGIEIEEDGHVHRLARIQPLLLKAETLDLAEIRRTLRRRHAVRRHANDVAVAVVGRRVKGQRRLAGEHADLALLGGELPGEDVGGGGVEGDSDTFGVLDGDDALGDVFVVGSGAAVGADGLASPAGGLTNLMRS